MYFLLSEGFEPIIKQPFSFIDRAKKIMEERDTETVRINEILHPSTSKRKLPSLNKQKRSRTSSP